MTDFRKSLTKNLPLFAVVFFAASLFLTFDTYCKAQVTPETPLINIAGLPFLRMDFVLIIFGAAFCIGCLAAFIFKKHLKALLSFALGACGLLCIVISLLTVDSFQTLFPLMRISHVTMTVSRLLAILSGITGGFIGAALSIIKCEKNLTTVAFAITISVLASLLFSGENQQNILYFICGLLILAGSVTSDFSKSDIMPSNKPTKGKSKNAVWFILTIVSILLFTSVENILTSSIFVSFSCKAVILGAVLMIVFIFATKLKALLAGSAILLSGILSYVITHFCSQTITYSQNRVVYQIPSYIAVICILISGVSLIFILIKGKVNERV